MKHIAQSVWLTLLSLAAAGVSLNARANVAERVDVVENQSLVCLIGSNMAVASGGSAITVDGVAPSHRTGWLYVLRKDAGKWRVVALVPHDSRSQVSCENAARVEDESTSRG